MCRCGLRSSCRVAPRKQTVLCGRIRGWPEHRRRSTSPFRDAHTPALGRLYHSGHAKQYQICNCSYLASLCGYGCARRNPVGVKPLSPRKRVEKAQSENSPLLGIPRCIEPEWLPKKTEHRRPTASFCKYRLRQRHSRYAKNCDKDLRGHTKAPRTSASRRSYPS